MAVGLESGEAYSLLSQLVIDYPHIQLHNDGAGDPGANGTANFAGSGDAMVRRTGITWTASDPGTGIISNTNSIDWTDGEVDKTETYGYFSLWSAASAGNFGASGTISASQVNVTGDSFSILVGGLTLAFTVAA